MFWKKKKKPKFYVWATDRAREKGVFENVHSSVRKGNLTVLVTHFEETRRRLHEMLEQLNIEAGTINSPSELGLSNLEAQRSKRVVCLLPFSVLERAGPFQKERGAHSEKILLLIPEVHPTNEPDELIELWAESLPYSDPCEFYCAFDSPFGASIKGAQRMLDMMARFGMEEDESLEHQALKKAIRKAQKRNATRAKSNRTTESQEDWFKINL